MNRYRLLVVTVAAAAVLFLVAPSSAQAPELNERIARVHKNAVVVDTHIDTPLRLLDEDFDMDHRDPYGHIDIPRMQEGGLDAAFFSIWVDMDKYSGPPATARALQLIDAVYQQVARHPDKLVLATSLRDIQMAHNRGQIALLMGMEGANPLDDDFRLLRMFHRLGVRYLTLTHSKTSNWADSSTDEARHNGLTDFGKEIIREMNRLGMIVDISHVSDKAFFDALEVTKAPVLATHSSVRSLVGIPRNMTDEQFKAVAENGGVVQVAMGSWFIEPAYEAWYDTIKDDREARRKAIDARYADDPSRATAAKYELDKEIFGDAPRGTLQAVADHIEHIIKIAGVDHVGLGSDFDGVGSLPAGLDDVSFLPALTQELSNRGYSDADLVKILGGNTLRVMQEVERVAEPQVGDPLFGRRTFAQQPMEAREVPPYFRNERLAIHALRILQSCVMQYRAANPDKGFPSNSADATAPVRTDPEGPRASRCSNEVVGNASSANGASADGYRIRYQGGGDSFTITARPLEYGTSGKHSYFADQTGQVRATEENRPATAGDPPAR